MSTATAPVRAATTSGRGRGQLGRNLLAIGRRVGGLRGTGGLRWVLLLAAFLALTWGMVGGLLAQAVYDHRAEISRERTPVTAEDGPVRWGAASSFVGERIVVWIAIDQVAGGTDPSAPLPPGVAAWPQPGEAVVSPALAELLAEVGLPDRYGRVVGLVDPAALASPSELIAYARSPRPWLNERDGLRVAGFGVGPGETFDPFTGEVLYDRDVLELWVLAGLLMWLPGLLALASASRVADSATRRRHVLLARLGASARHRMVISLPPALSAGAVSAALGIAGLTWFAAANRRVPFTTFVLDAAVVRERLPLLALVTVITPAVGALLAAWLTAGRLGRLDAGRLTTPRDRPATARTVILLVVLAFQPWLVGRSGQPVVVMLGTVIGAAAAVLCLPGALADLVRGFAHRRAPRALATGRTGEFLAWRMTAARPRALARLAAALTGLIVIVAHALVVLGLFLGSDLQARQTAAQVGDAVGVVPLNDTAAAAAAATLATDNGLVAVRLDQHMIDDSAEVIAECGDLEALGLACAAGVLEPGSGPSWLAPVLAWYHGQQATMVLADPAAYAGDPETTSLSVLLMADPDGRRVDIDRLTRDAYENLEVPITVDSVMGSELRGAADLAAKSSWVYVFGAPGVIVLLLVGALTWAAVTIEETTHVLASPVLADQASVLDAVAAIRIALPVLLGGVAGVLVSAWLLLPHTAANHTPLPFGYFTSVLVATVLAAAMAGAAGRRLLGRRDRDDT